MYKSFEDGFIWLSTLSQAEIIYLTDLYTRTDWNNIDGVSFSMAIVRYHLEKKYTRWGIINIFQIAVQG